MIVAVPLAPSSADTLLISPSALLAADSTASSTLVAPAIAPAEEEPEEE